MSSEYENGSVFYLMTEFDDDLRDGVVPALTAKIDELSRVRDATIDVYINSPGGDGYLAFHIVHLIDLAKARGITVRTIVPQIAASAGSIVAVTGSPGHRYISDTAEHLMHYGQQSGATVRTPREVSRGAAEQQRWFQKIHDHYRRHCDIPHLAKKISDDHCYVPADKAIRWGMADKYMRDLPLRNDYVPQSD